MKLNATARAAIRGAGFTVAQWCSMWGYASGRWGGDQCGCFDDRCALGFHHDGTDDCGCLPVLLDQAAAWRQATRWPDSVELATAPYGLSRYVTVNTPGAFATVSASAGDAPAGRPAESVVKIEVRDGWTAETATDEHGRIVIRVVKAPEAEAAKGDTP